MQMKQAEGLKWVETTEKEESVEMKLEGLVKEIVMGGVKFWSQDGLLQAEPMTWMWDANDQMLLWSDFFLSKNKAKLLEYTL